MRGCGRVGDGRFSLNLLLAHKENSELCASLVRSRIPNILVHALWNAFSCQKTGTSPYIVCLCVPLNAVCWEYEMGE